MRDKRRRSGPDGSLYAGERSGAARALKSTRPIDRTFARVYEELRAIARSRLERGLGGGSLQATALVHEAWLKLASAEDEPELSDSSHFRATAAQAMRWILVDRARRRGRIGRASIGGDEAALEALAGSGEALDEDRTLALDAALARLEAVDPRKAQVVLLRHFGGLSVEETAEALGVSAPTVKREWRFARAWLLERLGENEDR